MSAINLSLSLPANTTVVKVKSHYTPNFSIVSSRNKMLHTRRKLEIHDIGSTWSIKCTLTIEVPGQVLASLTRVRGKIERDRKKLD